MAGRNREETFTHPTNHGARVGGSRLGSTGSWTWPSDVTGSKPCASHSFRTATSQPEMACQHVKTSPHAANVTSPTRPMLRHHSPLHEPLSLTEMQLMLLHCDQHPCAEHDLRCTSGRGRLLPCTWRKRETQDVEGAAPHYPGGAGVWCGSVVRECGAASGECRWKASLARCAACAEKSVAPTAVRVMC
jgi:hypothetical protein